MFEKLEKAINAADSITAIGTERPKNAINVVVGVFAHADPDDAVSHKSLFSLPNFPGMIFKTVKTLNELRHYNAYLLIDPAFRFSGSMPQAEASIVTDHAERYIVINHPTTSQLMRPGHQRSSTGNPANGSIPGVYEYGVGPVASGTSLRAYAVITDANMGMVTISTMQSGTDIRLGFLGYRFVLSSMTKALRSTYPKIVEGANSKERRCLDSSFNDELKRVDPLSTVGLVAGVAFSRPALRSESIRGTVGFLHHNNAENVDWTWTHSNGGNYPPSYAGTAYSGCFASSASMSEELADEVVTRVMQGLASAFGKDMFVQKGISASFSDEDTGLTVQEIMERSQRLIEVTPAYITDKTTGSARAVVVYNADGTTSVMPSLGAISVTGAGLPVVYDPLYRDDAEKLRNHVRRIYAGAEDYAKRYYG